MKLSGRLPAVAIAATALLVPATIAVSGGAAEASPARALRCSAFMTVKHPADYTTTDVKVRTVAHGRVRTTAYYKTVDRTYVRRAGASGRATVPYYISGATPGYTVVVKVVVHRGARVGQCRTSFTPHS
jgi:hypothetical protein